MIYLGNIVKVSETKSRVFLQHNRPDTLDEETLKEGMLVDSVPPEIIPDGKFHVGLFINPVTKELWREYQDIPKQPIDPIQQSINALGQTVAQEKIKSMQKDATISQLGKELASVKLEVIKLQGGTK